MTDKPVVCGVLESRAGPKPCSMIRAVKGKPPYHLCVLQRDHSGPHVCFYCGWSWYPPEVWAANSAP
jgi:hypothetical protein